MIFKSHAGACLVFLWKSVGDDAEQSPPKDSGLGAAGPLPWEKMLRACRLRHAPHAQHQRLHPSISQLMFTGSAVRTGMHVRLFHSTAHMHDRMLLPSNLSKSFSSQRRKGRSLFSFRTRIFSFQSHWQPDPTCIVMCTGHGHCPGLWTLTCTALS